jgi:hypothetical protein
MRVMPAPEERVDELGRDEAHGRAAGGERPEVAVPRVRRDPEEHDVRGREGRRVGRRGEDRNAEVTAHDARALGVGVGDPRHAKALDRREDRQVHVAHDLPRPYDTHRSLAHDLGSGREPERRGARPPAHRSIRNFGVATAGAAGARLDVGADRPRASAKGR